MRESIPYYQKGDSPMKRLFKNDIIIFLLLQVEKLYAKGYKTKKTAQIIPFCV